MLVVGCVVGVVSTACKELIRSVRERARRRRTDQTRPPEPCSDRNMEPISRQIHWRRSALRPTYAVRREASQSWPANPTRATEYAPAPAPALPPLPVEVANLELRGSSPGGSFHGAVCSDVLPYSVSPRTPPTQSRLCRARTDP